MMRRGEQTAERVSVTCPCGKEFTVTRVRFEAGRGKRCSRDCQNKYATRPSGLKYQKHKDNPTSFKPGQHASPSTEFQSGHDAWNKSITGTHFSPSTEFKPGYGAGESNVRWAGDDISYGGLHIRVREVRGPASERECLYRDRTCKGPMHWANVSHEYTDITDFIPLCQSHHVRYDMSSGAWGVAQKYIQTGVRPACQ